MLLILQYKREIINIFVYVLEIISPMATEAEKRVQNLGVILGRQEHRKQNVKYICCWPREMSYQGKLVSKGRTRMLNSHRQIRWLGNSMLQKQCMGIQGEGGLRHYCASPVAHIGPVWVSQQLRFLLWGTGGRGSEIHRKSKRDANRNQIKFKKIKMRGG